MASTAPPPSSSSSTIVPSIAPTTTSTPSTSDPYTYPPIYAFPPFFTLQPNPTTRSSQLHSWSTHIQAYARAHRLFTISLVDALPTPLFTNPIIGRSLSLRDARAVLSWMASPEGGNRAEWINPTKKLGKDAEEGGGGGKAWIYWRRPEEWAAMLEEWVERTGQKGTVLTLYEITESDATRREEFWGMDGELLNRSLGICVKRGKAQVFGSEGSEGVKFF
ncbi:ESCRT-II complex, vps25 subunit [Periconia macrospinosa]|uniref:ESCRT-II complex subunit VPS25 n=1 Tax=Periconia macrospinosa TaxID=97972 RepID=A0A2V1EG32_9PLEO|nr:ESCRT-II complex, vps25 subunit [Periconia macrospinosa]